MTYANLPKLLTPALAVYSLLGGATLMNLSSAEAATLTVKVQDILQPKGNILLAGYNSAENMKSHQVWQQRLQKVEGNQVELVFADVAPGQYAIMVFQDLNGDYQLNRNLMGIPTEPYGFSQHPSLHGAPNFAQIAFEVTTQDQTVLISLE